MALAEATADKYHRPATSLRMALPKLLEQDVVSMFRAQVELEKVVPAMQVLASRTLAEIKFSKEEMVSLLSAFNGTLLTPNFLGVPQMILHQMQDSHDLDNGIEMHGANASVLLEKIKGLTAAQAYYLLREIVLFWADGKEMDIVFNKFKA